jgi:TIR domain
MEWTTFANVDLRETKGLEEIEHVGPSLVQLYTIQLPQDGSMLHFLRGAGVPDVWISLYRAEMMHPIHYHSLFISYSKHDETLARSIHADLQSHGVRCWFAPEDLKIGDKIRARIDEAIHLQDKLLLLLSEHAIVSTWVEDEVEAALEKERRQQREVLFPIRLDEHVMQTTQPWAAKLRRPRHIGDFTQWKDHDAYQKAFEGLLRDLKAERNTKEETDGKPGTS